MNVAISTTISIGISTRQNSVSNYPVWAVFCGTSRWHILQLGRPLPGWRQYQLFSKYEPLKPFYIFPTDAMLGCFPQTTALPSCRIKMGISFQKIAGRVLSKSAGSRGSRGRFSMGQDGQKLVKTNKSPLCYQPRMRTATDWVPCVFRAMMTRGRGLP